MIENLLTILSFTLSFGMGLAFFIADPSRPNKWEVELDRIKRQSKKVDGFMPLDLPDSILNHLPKRGKI